MIDLEKIWSSTSCQCSDVTYLQSTTYLYLKLVRSLFSPKVVCSKLLSFWENRVFAFWRQDPWWRISAILDFRGPVMGSLKSPCATSYRSSIATIALNCLVFEKIFFFILATDRQTNRQAAPMHCRERRLNNNIVLAATLSPTGLFH